MGAAEPLAFPGRAAPAYAELLCLIRLQEIALAAPPPVEALRAMVDTLVTLPGLFRAFGLTGAQTVFRAIRR